VRKLLVFWAGASAGVLLAALFRANKVPTSTTIPARCTLPASYQLKGWAMADNHALIAALRRAADATAAMFAEHGLPLDAEHTLYLQAAEALERSQNCPGCILSPN
jgi:hypothetical protein